MKYISSLLQHFVSIDDALENIADKLTLSTCEIDDIYHRKIPDKVIIGYTVKVEKHPNADTLFVCHIDCGENGILQILTGGENIVPDAYVAVAIPGCFLPVPGLQIESRKMRGEDSHGMICSKEELGINEDTDKHWIWLLDKDFDDLIKDDIGKPLVEKYPRLEQWMLDIENKGITHRPDLTGHFGLAVELRALYTPYEDKKTDMSRIRYARLPHYIEQLERTAIQHLLEHADRATRKIIAQTDKLRSYVLVEIDAITIQSSHLFTRLQLLDLGHTSKNNWVDFSNLFMYLTGQPVHFFDADKVNGDIIVRSAKAGEVFVDLTGVEHILAEDDMIIADTEKILTLAGIIGGESSAISETTKRILVEIANFEPIHIRKTAMRLHLRTDAQGRFEKNIHPIYTLGTLGMFLDMRSLYAKDLGTYTLQGIQWYVSPDMGTITDSSSVMIDREACSQMMFGESNPAIGAIAQHILQQIGFTIHVDQHATHTVSAPVWRTISDIAIAEDVYEEVARIYGFNAIPSREMFFPLHYQAYAPEVTVIREMEEICMKELHADQLETYLWIDNSHIGLFDIDTSKLFSLQNSLSQEHRFLRDSMLYGLWEHVIKNSKFFDTYTVFDIGECHKQEISGSDKESVYGTSYTNRTLQMGMCMYTKSVTTWQEDTFLKLKSYAQHIAYRYGIGSISYTPTQHAYFHPKKQVAIICHGETIGYMGAIHPLVLKTEKFPENGQVSYLSICCTTIMKLQEKTQATHTGNTYHTLKDQHIYRDLCFVVDQDMLFDPIMQAIKQTPHVSDVHVFDVYQGATLGEGKKSIAVTLHIHGDGTLTTEQINAVMDQTIKNVDKAGGILRL